MPMAQIQPIMPTFTSANVKQIVTQAVQTALAKTQGSPTVKERPIANLTPAIAFQAEDVGYFNFDPARSH